MNINEIIATLEELVVRVSVLEKKLSALQKNTASGNQ